MTPYPHPQVNLDIFRSRLGADLTVDPSTFTVECGEPTPTALTPLEVAGGLCGGWLRLYNTQVDVRASGALTGEVDGFLYNRLDIGKLPFPKGALAPFLKGSAVTVLDLLEAINARWGTAFLPTDVLATALPSCECACGPIGFTFGMQPSNLIYIGQVTLYVVDDVSLTDAITQPFLPSPQLPILY